MSSFAAAEMERAPESMPSEALYYDDFQFDPIAEPLPLTPNPFVDAPRVAQPGHGRHRKPDDSGRTWDRENVVPFIWKSPKEPETVGRHRKENRWDRAKRVGIAAVAAIGLFTVASPDVKENTPRNEAGISADILSPIGNSNNKSEKGNDAKSDELTIVNSDGINLRDVSFNESGMAFPVRANKEVVENGSQAGGQKESWSPNSENETEYPAFDVYVPTGTDVLAVVDGTVTNVEETQIDIESADGKTIFTNKYLGSETHEVEVGDTVIVGQKIAEVGDAEDAEGSPPRLRLTALPTSAGYDKHPDCGGTDCNEHPFIDLKYLMVGAYEGLPEDKAASNKEMEELHQKLKEEKERDKEIGKQLDEVIEVAQTEYEKGVDEYDSNVLEYTTGRREPWCADFVSWVYKEAGLPFSGGQFYDWQLPSVYKDETGNMKAWFEAETDGSEYFAVGEKKPQPGDVAFYIGEQTPDEGSTSHVNLVVDVSPDGKTMTTIGGNELDALRKTVREVEFGEGSLVGFGRR